MSLLAKTRPTLGLSAFHNIHKCIDVSSKLQFSSRGRRNTTTIVTAAAAPKVVFEATGVPMVDKLLAMDTLPEAVFFSVKRVAIIAVSVLVATAILKLAEDKFGSSQSIIADVTCSLSRPSSVILPFFFLLSASKMAGALAQVWATKAKADFNQVFFNRGDTVLKGLESVTQILQDSQETATILFAAWFAKRLKDRIVDRIIQHPGSKEGLGRLIKPISTAINYLIFGVAGMAVLSAYGINIQPLLASLGASSVIVGIASQNLLTNVGAAVSLYTSRPFIAGDKVKLMGGGGGLVIEGEVIRIEPMRTVFRSTDGTPVYINNSSILGMMIQNDSQRA